MEGNQQQNKQHFSKKIFWGGQYFQIWGRGFEV